MTQGLVRVLLIEDDEDDAVLARQYLREIDPDRFELDWTPEFDVGLERIASGQHNVCLVDYQLGEHNGVEFIRRADASACNVPIILLTGQGDHSIDVAAMDAGAADFLNKGQLTPALLERSIRYAIQHRKAEDQRIKLLNEQSARKMAEAENRAKDQFLAVLSHELRTPLSAVLLNLSALEGEAEASPRLRELVQIIKRNVDLEARLIDDLLDLTRIARGKLELRRERVDVHQQIDFAVKTCCGSEIERKGLKVSVHEEAADATVFGDPARLQQVLWNLINNAAKFTPPGGSIDVRTFNRDATIVVEVRDTGIGISPEALPKIFNAFEQTGRAITREFGGLGLGLAICKSLVDLHGGKIRAASEGHGKGATFTLELPVMSAAPPQQPGNGQQGGAGGHAPRAAVSVLLVEDHADTARAMSTLLNRRGYQVRPVHSMAEALRAASETEFDVLISDIGLPDGSGLELMSRLRQQRPIVGIALSGFGMEEDMERSRQAGFTEHLTKPVDFQQLDAAISRATQAAGSESAISRTPVPSKL